MLYNCMNSSELRIHVTIVKIRFSCMSYSVMCDNNTLLIFVKMWNKGFVNVLIRVFWKKKRNLSKNIISLENKTTLFFEMWCVWQKK